MALLEKRIESKKAIYLNGDGRGGRARGLWDRVCLCVCVWGGGGIGKRTIEEAEKEKYRSAFRAA